MALGLVVLVVLSTAGAADAEETYFFRIVPQPVTADELTSSILIPPAACSSVIGM